MPAKIRNFIIREGKLIAISLFVGILLAISVAAYTYVYSTTTQRGIANNVIRFHVVANSDGAADQAVKDHIRFAILAEFEEYLSVSNNIEETRAVLTSKLPAMEAAAKEILLQQGFEYSASASITNTFFPTKFYGNLSFPPGEYEAVQILLGEGAGSNWWCLMFPPLCYVDMTSTEAGRQQLAETVPEEGFRLLMHQEENSPTIQVRFRVVEWWQSRRQPSVPEPDVQEQILRNYS